jgi:LDH2 family malate/lactate/ureidoglycolate dehydrogenase
VCSSDLQPEIETDPLSGAIARVNADSAPGPIALTVAMDEAIKKANEFNIGWCTIFNMTHAGRRWLFCIAGC